MTTILQASDPALVPGAVIRDEVVAARAPWSAVVAAGDVLTDRRPRRQPGRRLPALRRARPRPSATAPRTRSRPRATSSSHRDACCAHEGRAMMTIVADEVGSHDTIGGACTQESNTLRYGHHTQHQHACVENFLARGVAVRAGQARPRLQHQLVHERAGRRRRHARHRRRHLRPGLLRRRCAPRWTCSC